MDTNTLARIENEYSKLTENINKLGDYLLKQMNKKKTLTDNHYKLLIKQYAIMLQYANVWRNESTSQGRKNNVPISNRFSQYGRTRPLYPRFTGTPKVKRK